MEETLNFEEEICSRSLEYFKIALLEDVSGLLNLQCFFHKPTRKPHVTPLNLAHFSLTVLMPPCCSSIIAALHHKRPEITNLAPSSSSSSTRARVCSSCQSVRRPRYYRGNYFLYVKKSSWRSTSSEFRSGLRFHNYGIITTGMVAKERIKWSLFTLFFCFAAAQYF